MAKKRPFALIVLRTLFGITNKLFPNLADQWAVRLFLKPVEAPYTKRGKKLLHKAKSLQIVVNGQTLQGYTLGEGPQILCMHGWSGKSTQFTDIAWALENAGYQFISYDAPAHGANTGKSSSLFEFKELVIEACKKHDIVCCIGHSLGAASFSLAAYEGMHIPKFISLGAPVVGDDILRVFANTINGSKRTQKAIRQACLDRYHQEFDTLTMEHTFKSLKSTPVLGIHGTLDIDADVKHLDVLQSIHPTMITYKAEGLGHRRILKDDKVITLILEFIRA